MNFSPRAFTAVLTLGAVLSLSSCGSDVPITCPDVGVIKDAATFVQYRPGTGRDPVDVAYTARIDSAHLDCAFEDSVIETTVTFALTATRGPAAGDDAVSLPYFVAVVSTDERSLVSKRLFEIPVAFNGQQTVKLVQTVPGDATLVPRPADLNPGGPTRGGTGPLPGEGPRFNLQGPALYAGDRGGGGGGGERPQRRPGAILPGTQGAVPYQVLIGFQLDQAQLKQNREKAAR